MPPPPSGLEKPIKDAEQPAGVPRVALSSYQYLFNELAFWQRDHPSPAPDHTAWESRLAALGAQVGARSVGLALVNEGPHLKHRDVTTDDVTKFVATVMFKRWFDRPAPRHGAAERAIHYIEDEEPLILPLRPPTADFGDFHYGSYIAGMIRGALEAAGFPATVQALYPLDPPNATTQYVIQWHDSVLERERRAGRGVPS